MQCTNPINIAGCKLRCGKCLACRITRSRQWTLRIIHELDYYPSSCFLTLTYDDEHLPKDYSLHKEDLKNFFKRLRKSTSQKIKYFANGEYGEDYERPHYHIILLGLDQKSLELTWAGNFTSKGKNIDLWRLKQWQNGYVHVGTVTPDSCRYVTDYITKAYDGQQAEVTYGHREKPFQTASQGMGERYVQKNAIQIMNNDGVTLRGAPFGLPRYYRKKLDMKNPDYTEKLSETALVRAKENFIELVEKTGTIDKKALQSWEKLIYKQRDRDLKSKQNQRRNK